MAAEGQSSLLGHGSHPKCPTVPRQSQTIMNYTNVCDYYITCTIAYISHKMLASKLASTLCALLL